MQTRYEHPLDNLFNVEPAGMEEDEYDEVPQTALQTTPPSAPEVDADDVENDARFDQVYEMALETFQNQTAMVEIIEPRYAARTAEVAASYLNIALQAASAKARVKSDRKRATAFIPGMGAGKVTNNTIVATREEILRMISVDADHKEIK